VSFPCDRPVRLHVSSLPAHLPVVRGAIEKVCELLGFADEETGSIVLSVDEAMTNVIRHAYGGDTDQPIEVELTALGEDRPDALRIRLRDYGKVVDRSKIKPRKLDDIRPGGLGVHIMMECMDVVDYSPAEGGGTRLTMVKTVPARKEAHET
jgi:anti-sigma regulatory factor (Ser/Thr protein kinase)